MQFKTGSRRISGLTQSDIRSMTIECIKHEGINLGQGLCETATPEAVIKTAQESLAIKQHNLYSSPEGIGKLREKIAGKLLSKNKISANPDREIIVTHGATGGYASALMALLNPGDGILLFQPYYGYHVNTAILAGLEPQYLAYKNPKDEISLEDLTAGLKANTKAIVVCTPSNPIGKMFNQNEINVIAEFAEKNDLLVITDEMYEYFAFDGHKHISPASHEKIWPRSVSLMGLSKTFSITGWRLGYLSAPTEICEKIRLANDLFYVCATTPLQYGVAAGFDLPQSHFDQLINDFTKKREKLCSSLEKAGFQPIIPQGAYYVMANIEKFGAPDSKSFAMDLLQSAKVAVIPGRAFFNDPIGENFVRANFALDDDKLDEACKRIEGYKGGF